MKRFLLLLIAVFLVINISAYSQNASFTNYNFYDFDFLGGGARAEGMGKAFIAVSDDITGGTWNPAGLHEFEKPTLGVSWGSLNPRGSSSVDFFNYLEADHTGSFSSIGSLNFVSPIRIKGHPFVGSFNYSKNFDVFEQFNTIATGDFIQVFYSPIFGFVIDTVDFQQSQDNLLEGGLYSLNFAIGTRFYNKLSMGLSANVYAGSTLRTLEQRTTLFDFLYQDLIQRGLYEQNVTIVDSNKFSGINFTLGLKYNGDRFNAGLIVKTPFNLSVNRKEAIYSVTSYNGLITEQGTDSIFIGDLLLKYAIPLTVGTGISYQVNDNFMFAADVEYRGFKGNKILNRESITINPAGTNEETFTELDPGWQNSLTFRLGVEYLKQTGIGEIPFRAGFGYVPVPDPNTVLSPTGLSTIDTSRTTAVAYNISLGSGIHWEQIHFDVAYTYYTLNRNYELYVPTEVGVVVFHPGYKVRNHHFNVSFTGVF